MSEPLTRSEKVELGNAKYGSLKNDSGECEVCGTAVDKLLKSYSPAEGQNLWLCKACKEKADK